MGNSKKDTETRRGDPGMIPSIRLAHIRPDSIPTTELPYSDIDYGTLQEHLGLSVTEMHLARTILVHIIVENTEISKLKLRAMKDRQRLCDTINVYTGRFQKHLGHQLQDTDKRTGAVGWLLYQLALYCLKDKQSLAYAATTSATVHIDQEELIGSNLSTPRCVNCPGQGKICGHMNDGLASGDDGHSDFEDEDDSSSDDSQEETMSQTRGPGTAVGELERLIAPIRTRRDPGLFDGFLFFTEPHRYAHYRGGGLTSPRKRALQRYMNDSEDDEERDDPPQPSRALIIFTVVCVVAIALTFMIMSAASYLHAKRGQEKLWQTVLPPNLPKFARASAKTVRGNAPSH
ncbi:hypothetical protein TWF696_008631 [Orbilia brochopaga]|uniref:Uncharacterized protein n=1 Tax=Orbilia brochopaga TaxID=3140254 RepID=A0AAV9UGQ8_9PEZI